MDIQGWLQDAADRAAPVPSDDLGALAFGRPIQGIEATTTIPRRRTRKRAASDSPVIAPQQPTGHRGKADGQSANPARDRPVQVIVSRSGSASRHPRSVIQDQDQDHEIDERAKRSEAKTYERRPRHKTKPGRYDPHKQKVKARKQRDDGGEQKSKRKRSRVNRGGDGKRTENLVQGFRLKNGPSNSRLTLNPDTAAGMFKHGRTSAQMLGRRDGLPDLVFNELRFLRNHNEHQDEHQLDENRQKPSHQGSKREAEREEISAYFNQRKSNDKVLQSPPDKQRARHRKPGPKHGESSSVREDVSSRILPDDELTAIPYIGFGSKGTVNQSSHPQPSESTYLTWSESLGVTHPRENFTRNHKPAQEPHQSSTPKPSEPRPTKRKPHVRSTNDTAKKPIRASPFRVQTGHWSASRRIRGPARVEVYTQRESADDRHDPLTETQGLHDNTSLSLPTRPLADSKHIQPQNRRQEQQAIPSDSESFHTSDILKIRGRLGVLVGGSLSDIHDVEAPQSNKENVQPLSSSSSIAKVLRTAHEAITKTHDESNMQSPMQANLVHANVQATALRLTSRSHASLAHQLSQQYSRELIESDLARQPLRPASSIPEYRFDQRLRRDTNFETPYAAIDSEDDEMLDNGVAFQPGIDVPLDARSGRTYENAYLPTAAHSGAQSIPRSHDRLSTWARDISWSGNGTSNVVTEPPSQVMNAVRGSPAEDHYFAGGDFEDGLEGFWRPNRLY